MSRSRPGADRQAGDLRDAGFDVLVLPVIEVEALRPAPPADEFDTVIFLSEHAVAFGLPLLADLGWLPSATVLAVGPTTAAALGERDVSARVPPTATSEGLLALPELAAARRVLIVGGVGGRGLIATALAARGVTVARCDCYQRRAAVPLESSVLRCDAVIAASVGGLEQVAEAWLGAGGRVDVPVLVPSARVAARGVELGFCNLHDCAGADSDAWLRGLARVQSAGTS